MKIFLVRHGQTTGDIENRYGGDYEDHLTETGRKQASELANKLSGKGIEVLFVSPRIRARETAEIVNERLKIKTTILDDIRERNHYGVMSGMTKKEAQEKYPGQVELLTDKKNTILGGEDYESFGIRVKKAVSEVCDSGYQTVAIISHGGPIRFIFRKIIGAGEVEIDDCGFAELEYNGGKLSVLRLDGIEIVS